METIPIAAIGGTALRVSVTKTRIMRGLLVVAKADNTVPVFVGNSAVTAGTNNFSGIPVFPGGSAFIPKDQFFTAGDLVADTSNAYVVASGGSNTVYVIVDGDPDFESGTSVKLAANSGVDVGDVDVTSLPAIPAGDNNIGNVDIVTVPNPPLASVFSGALNGTATQTVTDITGATAITANTVFQGHASISLTAAQTAALAAAGTVRASITWVPGSGGTTAVVVAAIDLNFGLGGVTNLSAPHAEENIMVPVLVYVGTTAGKFQVTVATTGTISTLAWDVTVCGSAR